MVLERLSSEAFCTDGLERAYRVPDRAAAQRRGLADPILERGSTNNVCEFRCEGGPTRSTTQR